MTIKLIIADSDGTIIDLKELHFHALNKALSSIDPKFVITENEHIKTFDGLTTSNKLKILAKTKQFPLEKSKEINALKQKYTVELLKDFTNINHTIKDTVAKLKSEGYGFFIASNAIRKTVEIGIEKLGITNLVDKIYANEDVKNAKPNPEIYLKCMIDAGVSPEECLIIEDSRHGREAAIKSGGHLCAVDNSFDFSYERIKSAITRAEKKSNNKWHCQGTTNVLIPMSGRGSRFDELGYKLPKPLIDVNGAPMIQRVVENLNIDANFIFIVQKQHYEKYNLGTYLNLLVPGCTIVQAEGLTEGAACSALLAKSFIDNSDHLLIANSDQILNWDSSDFMFSMLSGNVDGGIMTFPSDGSSKWSYARLDENDYVCEVAEKKVISDHPTTGIYYYSKGSEFVKYAEQMISKNIRVNNEFYICPIYNEYIEDDKKIKIYEIEKFFGIGVPDDLSKYFKHISS